MYDNAIDRLRRARLHELETLGPATAALMLWALPPDERLDALRCSLTTNVQKYLRADWLRNAPAPAVFTVLAALVTQKSSIPPEHLAVAVKRLVHTAITPGGPYAFAGSPTFGVNAVIANFAAGIARPLPQLGAFLRASHTLPDPDFLPIAIQFLRTTTGIDHPLHFPTSWQGSWRAEQLACGEQPSAIATTAVMLALQDWQRKKTARLAVTQQVSDWFAPFDWALTQSVANFLTQLSVADTSHEITLTTRFFADSLRTPPCLNTDQITTLDAATVCGWMAYMTYDSFLDGVGQRPDLPTANVAMRQSVAAFQSVAMHATNSPDIHAAFATMDNANSWELARTRCTVHDDAITITTIPMYKSSLQLAERSIAHTLGPRIVLAAQGVPEPHQRHVTRALTHYLAARQLCDDLYDWQDDLAAGQLSFVVSALLQQAAITPGTHNIHELKSTLQEPFAAHVLAAVTTAVHDHLNKASQLLTDTQLFTPHNTIDTLIARLRSIATTHPRTQAEQRAFLHSFAQS